MKKTMTNKQVGAAYGVSEKVIERHLGDYGVGLGTVYRPRMLRKWPAQTCFQRDDLAVRD